MCRVATQHGALGSSVSRRAATIHARCDTSAACGNRRAQCSLAAPWCGQRTRSARMKMVRVLSYIDGRARARGWCAPLASALATWPCLLALVARLPMVRTHAAYCAACGVCWLAVGADGGRAPGAGVCDLKLKMAPPQELYPVGAPCGDPLVAQVRSRTRPAVTAARCCTLHAAQCTLHNHGTVLCCTCTTVPLPSHTCFC